jgi:hypothetical protein
MIAALLAAAAVTPAAEAGDPPAASVAAPTTAKPTSRYIVRYDAKRDRYCVRERGAAPITGSRLVAEQCKTGSDWAADGLIIARKQ